MKLCQISCKNLGDGGHGSLDIRKGTEQKSSTRLLLEQEEGSEGALFDKSGVTHSCEMHRPYANLRL
jgi:hypothetical protein